MARIDSLNVLLDPSGKMLLSELYKGVVENVQKMAVSMAIKNQDLSGDPEAGSVEAKRFQNAAAADYGTARTAGAGSKVKGKPVTIQIDTDREFVEEIEAKDIKLLGVQGLLERRSANHQLRLRAELDTKFFAEMLAAGYAFVPDANASILDTIEAAILKVETTKNEYVDGVPRDMITVVCSPETYSEIRNNLDNVKNANVTTDMAEFDYFHGCKVFSEHHIPTGVKFFVAVDGSVAQPVLVRPYTAERIPLSEAMAVSMFFYYGTKAVTPDLIMYVATASGITITAAAGSASGNTKLTVVPATAGSGNAFVYKTGTSVAVPFVGEDLTAWTSWNGTADIAAATGNDVVVAIIDSATKKCIKAGKVKSIAHA